MFQPYRQRRGPYALARPSPVRSLVRLLILVGILLLILYVIGRWILGLFDMFSVGERGRVDLTVEDRGVVSVSIDGGLLQRVDGSSKLYAGDRVTTGANGQAVLSFFDRTFVRLDGQTDLLIDESAQQEEGLEIALTLAKGRIWMETPAAGSGTAVRTVEMGEFTLEVPPSIKASIALDAVKVFSSGEEGIRIRNDVDGMVVVDEGQSLSLSDAAEESENLLAFRSALSPAEWEEDFVRVSLGRSGAGASSTASAGDIDATAVVVTSPAEGTVVRGSTVRVEGRMGRSVVRVRVNGYQATVQESAHTFSQELSLPDGVTEILVEGLDARGIVLSQVRRNVRREVTAPGMPTITSPAKSGETYRTQKTEIMIAGTAPANATGIMVNDYQLQLFKPGDTTWKYLATVQLGNLKSGTNTYDVRVINETGQRSDPVRITILLEEGAEGTVSSAASASSVSSVSETSLPQNDPLQPGTLKVTGPTAGQTHTATGSELLIEGTTSAQTASVWVNGYRLQLYTHGKTTWNYIAKTDFGNLKRGENVYKINARDSENRILDSVTYIVTLRP